MEPSSLHFHVVLIHKLSSYKKPPKFLLREKLKTYMWNGISCFTSQVVGYAGEQLSWIKFPCNKKYNEMLSSSSFSSVRDHSLDIYRSSTANTRHLYNFARRTITHEINFIYYFCMSIFQLKPVLGNFILASNFKWVQLILKLIFLSVCQKRVVRVRKEGGNGTENS